MVKCSDALRMLAMKGIKRHVVQNYYIVKKKNLFSKKIQDASNEGGKLLKYFTKVVIHLIKCWGSHLLRNFIFSYAL